MLKISEFARLSGVPAKTLRYYDEIGLFVPAGVDPENGYRMYTEEQISRLTKILHYKTLGFSLALIRKILDENINDNMVNALLRQRKFSTIRQLEAARELLRDVESEISEREKQDEYGNDDTVNIKSEAEKLVLLCKSTVPTIADCGRELYRLSDVLLAFCHAIRISPYGPAIALYYSFAEDRVELGLAFPVSEPVEPISGIACEILPAVEEMAYLYHHGPLEEIDPAHQKMFHWLDDHQRLVDLPVRDVYLALGPDLHPKDYLTEIQYPLKKLDERPGVGTIISG